ncbi:hypothetical protein JQ633_33435 [Bradyrhizobium tropiciagri]|uniref:hypothetical protein n=1 Tax=Bradyrhizobium tropiciagri TaxID=312253 RepID=UPI001BA64BE4|nr:hypothetical protein [Bradyrhizobium tropiciagri]MBR0875303.1 hypothetical protein [Bradyrhizobium tropiciagri]
MLERLGRLYCDECRCDQIVVYFALAVEGEESAVRPRNANRLAVVELDDDVGDLLLRAGVLRHGITTMEAVASAAD